MFPDDGDGRGLVCRDSLAGTALPQARVTTYRRARSTRQCPTTAAAAASLLAGTAMASRCSAAVGRHLILNDQGNVLHRDLDIAQKSAWRRTASVKRGAVTDPFDDEAHFGGREKNKHGNKKLGRDWGKTTVAHQGSGNPAVVPGSPDAQAVRWTIGTDHEQAWVYTDDAHPESPNGRHSVAEYVREQAHTNGVESPASSEAIKLPPGPQAGSLRSMSSRAVTTRAAWTRWTMRRPARGLGEAAPLPGAGRVSPVLETVDLFAGGGGAVSRVP